ncbi:MAG: indolepyruvate oxidoreductase subunit beta [Actinobacteria bacterium]|nr:indolepyruvate oxidoreductase subunit beta [Actinomycetota bacterium]
MKADVVLAGVGGQGVLSVAVILAEAGRRQGLQVKQGEVHGMSQRGGAVFASVRLADAPIDSDLVPRGSADLLVGLEPLEALRYVEFLGPGGILVTSADSMENIPNYPPLEEVHRMVALVPDSVLVEAGALAMEVGSPRAANVVMVGAASVFLPLDADLVAACVADGFAAKGERVAAINRRAFEAGRAAVAAAAAR